MRILLPHHSFEDSFADNVQDTLVSMGHEVRTLGAVARQRYWGVVQSLWRMSAELVPTRAVGPVDRAVVRLAKEFQPQLVLSTTSTLHPETLAALRRYCHGRRVLWWGDPPANSTKWGVLDPGWDAVFLKDRAAVSKLRMVGRPAYLLHEAMNPKWHHPVATQQNNRVAIVGSFYAYRQAMALRLHGDGIDVDLRGPRPPRWADPEIVRLHSGSYVVREAKSAVFGQSLGCLNTFTLAEGNSLNCRAFEIAGAGGLQFFEDRPVVSECFEPGKELLVFSEYSELLDHIAWAKREPALAQEMRLAGARRALAEHTYRHRLEHILRTIA